MMKTLSLRNWLQSKETDTFVSIVEKQQNKHQFTQATSSMKQEIIDLQAIHTTSKHCAIIATSTDDIKTQLKQVNDSMKNDREDMMNCKQNTLNIWISEALTSIEWLKEINDWESSVKKWKLMFQSSSIDKDLFHKQEKMKVIQKKIESLIPYEFNNKIHDETQVNRIANSIKEFWFTQPIVIDKNNVVVIWHGRLEASQKLWLKEVPCVIMEDLNDEQIRKLRILDNKLNESEWNIENLQYDLSTIKDFNIWDIKISVDDLFDDVFSVDDFDENFSLPDWEKAPFSQMTFTLADEQKKEVEEAIKLVKQTDQYKSQMNFWNDNSNWNALYCIVQQWLMSNK